MTLVGWLQIAIVLALVLATAIPLSGYIVTVYSGKDNFLSPVLRPVERIFYRLAGVDETREQTWLVYAMAMIAFSIAGFVLLYALQRFQNVLPLNPQGFDAVPADLAFNTSISFITNTNWQNYAGETTMSHLTQMLGLTVHNFVSAATGLAMAFAFVRAFARSSAATVGNFWVDMSRVVLYILLPIATVLRLYSLRSACRRHWSARSMRRRSKGSNRQFRSDRSRARKLSRSLAPTAAGS
jgi:K+-transporting ATPase ATPase A chain